VFKAEDAIAAINVDVADFSLNFSTDPADPVIICLSAGESMKRHEQSVAGKLWMQGDRKMSGQLLVYLPERSQCQRTVGRGERR
jgi:hypothetical protein